MDANSAHNQADIPEEDCLDLDSTFAAHISRTQGSSVKCRQSESAGAEWPAVQHHFPLLLILAMNQDFLHLTRLLSHSSFETNTVPLSIPSHCSLLTTAEGGKGLEERLVMRPLSSTAGLGRRARGKGENEGEPGTADDIYIETRDLCRRIAYELKHHSIPQAVFAEKVLCRCGSLLPFCPH